MPDTDDRAPFGTYAPSTAARCLLSLSRNTPLGRGGARRAVHDRLVASTGGIVDGTLWGRPFRAYLSGNLSEWKAFLKPTLYDPDERAIIRQAMDRPAAVFIDIGANVGIFTLYAIAHARPDARIVAFEPHPETFRRLAFNLAQTPHSGVMAVRAALGDVEGTGSISGDDLSLMSLNGGGTGIDVPMQTLRAALQRGGISHIDALKIDVEGAEDIVLADFIRNVPQTLVPRCVVIEALGRGRWRFDCIDGFRERGLHVVREVGNNVILAA